MSHDVCYASIMMWMLSCECHVMWVLLQVLNHARENIPTDRHIWISAAKLEEANDNFHMVPKIIERGKFSDSRQLSPSLHLLSS